VQVQIRERLRPFVPQPVIDARRAVIRGVRRARAEWPLVALRLGPLGGLDRATRKTLARRLHAVHDHVECAHTHGEISRIIREICAIPDDLSGCIVEAGCFKGGSTAKLSIAAAAVGRRLVVFDLFDGFPVSDDSLGVTIFGDRVNFGEGRYAGRLSEVCFNVSAWGDLDVCEIMPGRFEITMPRFVRPIAVGFIDVDLATSMRTCLECLYPHLIPGGVLFIHDGHRPLCLEVMRDQRMWQRIGGSRPVIRGVGTGKLVAIRRPFNPFEV
jgi:O-methyltransferase